jgi:hypothetical protein
VCGFDAHDEVFWLRVVAVVSDLLAASLRGVSGGLGARREESQGLRYDTRSMGSVT